MSATAKSVLLVGATGLVGRECLRLLLPDALVSRVVVIARRPLSPDVHSPRMAVHVMDFDRLSEHASLFDTDAIICTLGTTIRDAGSRERFRAVDFGFPLAVAQLGRAGGARHFLLVSALGADATSRVFYNRVKGELESAVLALGYPRVTIVRPSLLLGRRTPARLGEEVAKRVVRWVGPVVPRGLRPVEARRVAEALVREAHESASGVRIISSAEIRKA
ncbi:MAG TPA: NAD(P)H-binding protein [Gemmatimonadaceae bacterium]|nr:NAD(P)H-binding protein [Gemmatimonadaceae bacterium]